jgi:geranylgeranyl reductase
MYNIAIVGGGPAGSILAKLIGRKYKILLLDKRKHIDNRTASPEDKCCGGLIDPDAQRMLARFGLGVPKAVLLSPQLFAVRVLDMQNKLERYYQRHYINIDRKMFDRWMLSIVPETCKIICGAVFKDYEETGKGVSIKFNFNGRDYTEKAMMLVGADGAFSRVRRAGFAGRPSPRKYISIQQWFRADNPQSFYGAIFDSDITDFYSWTIPKEDMVILSSALKLGKDACSRFELLKSRLSAYGFNFENPIRTNGAYLLRPDSLSQICTGAGRTALVGEAAGLISPSSAEGLSYAFKSSLALARVLENGIEGFEKSYKKNLSEL